MTPKELIKFCTLRLIHVRCVQSALIFLSENRLTLAHGSISFTHQASFLRYQLLFYIYFRKLLLNVLVCDFIRQSCSTLGTLNHVKLRR